MAKYKDWTKEGRHYYPSGDSERVPFIQPGTYEILYSQEKGYSMYEKNIILDELIDLPFPETTIVMNAMDNFWKMKNKFMEYNYTWKRGILLYGIPGGGKTSIINMLSKKLIREKNGIIITLSDEAELNKYAVFMPSVYRAIEPDRPVMSVIEDIDGLCHSGLETKLINVLDGIEQMNNVVYIATTNYTERLPERILNRPNRFDIRVEIKSPNAECRKIYFEKKLKKHDLQAIDINEWVRKTEGLNMAALGEVIKSVIVMGNNFEETMDRLESMRSVPNSRNYDKGNRDSLGFWNGIISSNTIPSIKELEKTQ